jgi:hypothetical protein
MVDQGRDGGPTGLFGGFQTVDGRLEVGALLALLG